MKLPINILLLSLSVSQQDFQIVQRYLQKCLKVCSGRKQSKYSSLVLFAQSWQLDHLPNFLPGSISKPGSDLCTSCLFAPNNWCTDCTDVSFKLASCVPSVSLLSPLGRNFFKSWFQLQSPPQFGQLWANIHVIMLCVFLLTLYHGLSEPFSMAVLSAQHTTTNASGTAMSHFAVIQSKRVLPCLCLHLQLILRNHTNSWFEAKSPPWMSSPKGHVAAMESKRTHF